MTTTLTQYTDLVTSEHADKPNFLATLAAILQPLVDGINVVGSMPGKFDADVAVGQQLDFTGQWVGISRNLRLPIAGVYFSFDIVGLGFDEGVWFSSQDPAEGVISLDDGTYRQMIYAKIAANVWDGSLGDANQRLADIFGMGVVTIEDNFDMTQTITVTGSPISVLFEELVEQGYIQIRPAAVESI